MCERYLWSMRVPFICRKQFCCCCCFFMNFQFNSIQKCNEPNKHEFHTIFYGFFSVFHHYFDELIFFTRKKIMRFYRNNIWLIRRMLLCTEIRVDKQSNRACFYRYLDIPLKCILMSSQILSYRWIKPQR